MKKENNNNKNTENCIFMNFVTKAGFLYLTQR